MRGPRRGSVGAGVLAGALVLGACATETDLAAGSSPNPTPSGPPHLLVASGSSVSRWEEGASTELGSVGGRARLAVDAGDAGVLVEALDGDEETKIVFLDDPDEPLDTPRADRVTLFEAPVVDGEAHVLYATYAEDPEPTGDVLLQGLEEGDRRRVAPAAAVEFSVSRASYGRVLIVLSAVADLTEDFSYYLPDGTEVIERPDPTDGLVYNAPPFMTQAVLGADGRSLAYLEGPDWDPEAEAAVGDWELVVIDQADGDERVRLEVAPGDEEALWLDFDGRWAVFSRAEEQEPLPVLLVDTLADDPEPRDLEVRGTATILDGGR